jgi:hypothetical protein
MSCTYGRHIRISNYFKENQQKKLDLNKNGDLVLNFWNFQVTAFA